jgi:hypothetical protein
MVKYLCDRCGAEIKNTLYYVNISSDSLQSLNRQDICDLGYATAVDTLQYNMSKIPAPRIYCETCMCEIKEFCEVNKNE